MSRVRDIALAVLRKISDFLVQEPDSLLGVEDQIEQIETILRKKVISAHRSVCNAEKVRGVLYDIEDAIDELVIAATNRRRRIAFIRGALASGDLPKHFFYVLAIDDLINHHKIQKKMKQLKTSVSSRHVFSSGGSAGSWELFFFLHRRFDYRPGAGLWKTSFGLDLNAASIITFPAISKLEGLVAQELLISPAVRKQARRLRDEFKSLHDFIRQADSKELTEEGMVWMEELCDACRSTENVVGLFMDYQQYQMKNGGEVLFRNLAFAPRNFITQRKLANQMARIKDKIYAISCRKYTAFQSPVSLHGRFNPCKGSYSLRASDQIDPVSFDEDVDAITAKLLKDDPRCITVSIVGVKGIGKTSLASLIYNGQAIAHHFPCRIWVPEPLRVHWYTRAKEANFLQGHSDKTGGVRRLADHLDPSDALFDHIHGNNSSFLNSCYSNVVSFLSFDTREQRKAGEDIDNFLDRCISSNCFHFLWVLDLECVYKPKLPKAVSQLTRLKYLGLRSTYLETLPTSIDQLLTLQTMDLKRTCIINLPRSIWKMQQLRHLFLDESFRSKFVPRQDGKTLVELQTLWGVFIDEDSPVRNGLDTLTNITKLGLKCKISEPSKKVAMSSQLVTVANWVENLKQLQSLRLKSFDESNQPWDLHLESLSSHVNLTNLYLVGKLKNQQLVSQFPKNLIELTMSASGLAEDPMQILDELPNLRIVILLLGSFTGKKMLCKFGGFPKLEVLKLKKLMELEEWNVEEGALPSLKDLEIESCSNLKIIPDGLRLVRTLRQLKLAKFPIISSRIKENQGEDWIKIAHVRHICTEE